MLFAEIKIKVRAKNQQDVDSIMLELEKELESVEAEIDSLLSKHKGKLKFESASSMEDDEE